MHIIIIVMFACQLLKASEQPVETMRSLMSHDTQVDTSVVYILWKSVTCLAAWVKHLTDIISTCAGKNMHFSGYVTAVILYFSWYASRGNHVSITFGARVH